MADEVNNSEETLDEFLDKLGKKPAMQDGWDKVSYDAPIADTKIIGEVLDSLITPSVIVNSAVETIKDNFKIDRPPVGEKLRPGTPKTDQQQRANIGVISYALTVQGLVVNAESIYEAWPTEGDVYKLARAGKRPSINAIQDYMGTPEFANDMAERGVEFDSTPGGLSDHQIALLNILSDTSTNINLGARLKKAGVTPAKFKAWKRQRAFVEAYNRLTQIELSDAANAVDLALVSKAQSGDLRAIMYYNDLVGRGPNDKKAVDAMQFAKIVLEAVMKIEKDPEKLKAISAEIELASKQLGS